MWGTTGCDIMVIGGVTVRKIVGKIGRVSDGNSVDDNDGSDGNGVISEVAHMGFRSACSSCVVFVTIHMTHGLFSFFSHTYSTAPTLAPL